MVFRVRALYILYYKMHLTRTVCVIVFSVEIRSDVLLSNRKSKLINLTSGGDGYFRRDPSANGTRCFRNRVKRIFSPRKYRPGQTEKSYLRDFTRDGENEKTQKIRVGSKTFSCRYAADNILPTTVLTWTTTTEVLQIDPGGRTSERKKFETSHQMPRFFYASRCWSRFHYNSVSTNEYQ